MSEPEKIEIEGNVVAAYGWVVILTEDYPSLLVAWERTALYRHPSASPRDWNRVLQVGFGDGVHPDKVEDEMRALPENERRIIATQNPSVLDCLVFESAEDLRSRVLVVREGEVVHMTVKEMEMLWDAWEAGIESVGQILRTRGLW